MYKSIQRASLRHFPQEQAVCWLEIPKLVQKQNESCK